MQLLTFASTITALACLSTATAQHPSCLGNGVGGAYLKNSPAIIGDVLRVELGSPNSPGGFAFLAGSDAPTPTFVPNPLVGTVCLSVFSTGFYADLYALDGAGNAAINAPVPADPALVNLPPLYLTALVVEGPVASPVFSISRTSRVEWEERNSYRTITGMQVGRDLHQATSLQRFPGDNRTSVLITGGAGGNFMQPQATNTTDLYVPLRRAFVPGPNMAVARGGHTSTLLADGRILIAGGVGTGGVVTNSVEIYDPVSNTFSTGPSLSTPRTGHRATRLRDGRVLVSGGFSDWQQAHLNFAARLNTAQATAEVFDPMANSWSPTVNAMTQKRAVHGQVELADGKVLVISGVRAGVLVQNPLNPPAEYPAYGASCDIFDPSTNAFQRTANAGVARGFFGASLLPDGRVLVTGGAFSDQFLSQSASVPTAFAETFDGIAWTVVQSLGLPVMLHSQTPMADGLPFVAGGMTALSTFDGTALSGWFDGSFWGLSSSIGTHPTLSGGSPALLAAHAATLLHDGTILVTGGSNQLTASSDGHIFVPR